MKTAVAIVSPILIALTVAVGGYFGVSNFINTRQVIQKRDSLKVEIAALDTQISGSNLNVFGETAALQASLDSVRTAFEDPEKDFKSYFLRQGMLHKVPRVEFSEPKDTASWTVHPFNLKLEGSEQAIDSFLVGLTRELYFVRFAQLRVSVSGSKIKLETQGQVSVPKEFE